MNPSALIFVALAVAWAVYLIPKALEHHDEGLRSRTVSTFSHTLRVLARREPINRRKARLVPSAAAATKRPEPAVETTPVPRISADLDAVTSTAVLDAVPADDQPAPVRRAAPRLSASAVAARRRRRVLGTIVVALVAVVALAALSVVPAILVAVPVVVLVAWLVACRLMVKHERGARGFKRPLVTDVPERAAEPYEATIDPDTGEIAVVTAQGREVVREAGSWDPVDVPLPTYVAKPTASRRVGALDLDSTGVWSSGRSDAESALARDLDARRAAAMEEAEQRHLSERRRTAGA